MTTELKADPRTGLEIIDVPSDYDKYFSDLKGCLIHWFGVVDKYNRLYRIQKRIAIFTDQCIYLCRPDSFITRCVHIQNIQEVLLTERTAIGFRVGPPDFDMLISVNSVDEREAIFRIVSKVYWSLVGQDLVVRRLSGDSGEAMSQNLQLEKPKGHQPNVVPMRTVKSLTKLMLEKEAKDKEDRRVVQEEFDRIKSGLRAQLEQYRSEEYDRMVDQLSSYVKALEEKDLEIVKLKENSVSLDDPEVWRQCPNCTQLRSVLESNPNDDKQKILRLEREIESQRHIVEHLQAAIQHRTGHTKGVMENSSDSSQLVVLRQELAESTRKNKEMQQLILESPYLTSDVKNRAARMAFGANASGGGGGGGSGMDSTNRSVGAGGSIQAQEALAEKDREIRHLKSVLRDTTFRQVQELESIRTQFQQYDAQIVEYLEKVFSGQIQTQRGTPAQMARATAEAARYSATPSAFNQNQQQQVGAGGYQQQPSIRDSPFKQFVAPEGYSSSSSPAASAIGASGVYSTPPRANPLMNQGASPGVPAAASPYRVGGGGSAGGGAASPSGFTPNSKPYGSTMGGMWGSP